MELEDKPGEDDIGTHELESSILTHRHKNYKSSYSSTTQDSVTLRF